jgi:hypothetical protein
MAGSGWKEVRGREIGCFALTSTFFHSRRFVEAVQGNLCVSARPMWDTLRYAEVNDDIDSHIAG